MAAGRPSCGRSLSNRHVDIRPDDLSRRLIGVSSRGKARYPGRAAAGQVTAPLTIHSRVLAQNSLIREASEHRRAGRTGEINGRVLRADG